MAVVRHAPEERRIIDRPGMSISMRPERSAASCSNAFHLDQVELDLGQAPARSITTCGRNRDVVAFMNPTVSGPMRRRANAQ